MFRSGIEAQSRSDTVDLVVLSDHGMATVNKTETINLDVHLSKVSSPACPPVALTIHLGQCVLRERTGHDVQSGAFDLPFEVLS